jgi:hypothetical protein
MLQHVRSLGNDTVYASDRLNSTPAYHVACVRAFFRPPERLRSPHNPNELLAYVEWFMDPRHTSNHYTQMLTVSRSQASSMWNSQRASVIPVVNIFRSCQLTPVFGQTCPLNWTYDNVLELAPRFFVNTYVDPHSFVLLRYM